MFINGHGRQIEILRPHNTGTTPITPMAEEVKRRAPALTRLPITATPRHGATPSLPHKIQMLQILESSIQHFHPTQAFSHTARPRKK